MYHAGKDTVIRIKVVISTILGRLIVQCFYFLQQANCQDPSNKEYSESVPTDLIEKALGPAFSN